MSAANELPAWAGDIAVFDLESGSASDPKLKTLKFKSVKGIGPFLFFGTKDSKGLHPVFCLFLDGWIFVNIANDPTKLQLSYFPQGSRVFVSLAFKSAQEAKRFHQFCERSITKLVEPSADLPPFPMTVSGGPGYRTWKPDGSEERTIVSVNNLGTLRLQLFSETTAQWIMNIPLTHDCLLQPLLDNGHLWVTMTTGSQTCKMRYSDDSIVTMMLIIQHLYRHIHIPKRVEASPSEPEVIQIDTDNLEISSDPKLEEVEPIEMHTEDVAEDPLRINPLPREDLRARKQNALERAKKRKPGEPYKPPFNEICADVERSTQPMLQDSEIDAFLDSFQDDFHFDSFVPEEAKRLSEEQIVIEYRRRCGYVDLATSLSEKRASLPGDWLGDEQNITHPVLSSFWDVSEKLTQADTNADATKKLVLIIAVMFANGRKENGLVDPFMSFKNITSIVTELNSSDAGSDMKQQCCYFARRLLQERSFLTVLQDISMRREWVDKYYRNDALFRFQPLFDAFLNNAFLEKQLNTLDFAFVGEKLSDVPKLKNDPISQFFDTDTSGCFWVRIDDLLDQDVVEPESIIREQMEFGIRTKGKWPFSKASFYQLLRETMKNNPATFEGEEEMQALRDEMSESESLEGLITRGLKTQRMHLWLCMIAYHVQNSDTCKEKITWQEDLAILFDPCKVKYVATKILRYQSLNQ